MFKPIRLVHNRITKFKNTKIWLLIKDSLKIDRSDYIITFIIINFIIND